MRHHSRLLLPAALLLTVAGASTVAVAETMPPDDEPATVGESRPTRVEPAPDVEPAGVAAAEATPDEPTIAPRPMVTTAPPTTTTAPPPTTTTLPPPPPTTTAPPPPITTAPPPPPPPPPAPATDSVWDALAQCESGGDWSINTGNGYYGGLQFAADTWSGLGGAGLPHENSREEQIRIATILRDQSGGYGAWPSCAAQLGL